MSAKTKKVYLNLIQAEVYARNPEIIKGISGNKSANTYTELRERVVGNAVVEELVQVPYPVTAESVNSFESSADYKRDIETAMNMPARGQNIGDCVDMQKFLSMDTESMQKLCAELSSKAQQVQQSQQAQQVAQQAQQKNEKEVGDK